MMLEIKNLHATVGDTRDPARHRPHGARAARCTPSWARTAPARARWRNVLAGRAGLRGHRAARSLYDGQDLLGAGARGARPRGRLPRLPVPGRDPRRQQHLLPAHGAQRASASTAAWSRARRDGLPRAGEGEAEARRHGPEVPEPLGQRGLLRRREEAQRDPPDGGARADARDPRRDRLRPRHRRAAHRRRRRQRAAQRPDHAIVADHPLPAPAQLHRARPRARAARRPHRQVGRQGAAARARGEGLRRLRGRPPA